MAVRTWNPGELKYFMFMQLSVIFAHYMILAGLGYDIKQTRTNSKALHMCKNLKPRFATNPENCFS